LISQFLHLYLWMDHNNGNWWATYQVSSTEKLHMTVSLFCEWEHTNIHTGHIPVTSPQLLDIKYTLHTSKYGTSEVTAYCQFVNHNHTKWVHTPVSNATDTLSKQRSLAHCAEQVFYFSVGGSPFSRCNMQTVSARGRQMLFSCNETGNSVLHRRLT